MTSDASPKRYDDLCTLERKSMLRVLGRYVNCSNGAVKSAWSGTGLEMRFEGTGIAVVHDGPRVRYSLEVDGVQLEDFFFEEGLTTRKMATDLEPGPHLVRIERQGEALFGVSQWRAILVEGGALLPRPLRKARQIEIFGDSISCGYGNEGTNVECGFSAETENHRLSYGRLLARRLDAEISTVAWSGKGVASNYGGEDGPTLVDLAERSVPQENSIWFPSANGIPHLVIINLGTNDYSTDHDPTDEEFNSAYERLLTLVRKLSPNALIMATVGPLLSGEDLARARKNIQSVVEARREAGDARIVVMEMSTTNDSPGCDYHPGLETHRKMAAELEAEVRKHSPW